MNFLTTTAGPAIFGKFLDVLEEHGHLEDMLSAGRRFLTNPFSTPTMKIMRIAGTMLFGAAAGYYFGTAKNALGFAASALTTVGGISLMSEVPLPGDPVVANLPRNITEESSSEEVSGEEEKSENKDKEKRLVKVKLENGQKIEIKMKGNVKKVTYSENGDKVSVKNVSTEKKDD